MEPEADSVELPERLRSQGLVRGVRRLVAVRLQDRDIPHTLDVLYRLPDVVAKDVRVPRQFLPIGSGLAHLQHGPQPGGDRDGAIGLRLRFHGRQEYLWLARGANLPPLKGQ